MAALPKEEGPCPSCTGLLDQLDGAIPHVEAAGANFAVVAKAPLDRVIVFARDHGWRHLRLSAAHNTFKRGYRGKGHQVPMMTVFHRSGDGTVRLSWASEMFFEPTDDDQDPRHNGTIEPLWTLFDLTPGGQPDFRSRLATTAARVRNQPASMRRSDCPYVPEVQRDDWPLEEPNGKPIERVRAIRNEIQLRVEELIEREDWA